MECISSACSGRPIRLLVVTAFAFVFAAFMAACGSAPTDVRTVVPADSLIYLETKNLGAALGAVVNHEKIRETAVSVPNASVLDGMEMAVAVTGFETTEQAISEENSVLNFKPRFVAVIETHLWNFQVTGFVEQQLGMFISEAYGGEATLETSNKHGGKYYVWTGEDGRKAYGLVIGSLVLFGNDESALEKCVAVRAGEEASIAGNPKLTAGDRLAFGFISADGVAQLSNIIGIGIAKRMSEENEVQSFVARVLPEMMRNLLKEASWTAIAADQGIEDRIDISLKDEIAVVYAETIVPSGGTQPERPAGPPPAGMTSVTRYDLRDPQIVWRSVLLSSQKLTDQASSEILLAFASSLFEPYGVDAPELFLSSVGPIIFTAKADDSGENAAVIATVRDADKLKRSLAEELKLTSEGDALSNGTSWRSEDGEVRAIIFAGTVIAGDPATVQKVYDGLTNGTADASSNPYLGLFRESNAAAATFGNDRTIAARIADVISEKKTENAAADSYYVAETRFNRKGIERRSISELGLIGTIISQFAAD